MVKGLVCVALTLMSKLVNVKVLLLGILPRDHKNNSKREKIKEINKLPKLECMTFTRVMFEEHEKDLTSNSTWIIITKSTFAK